MKRLHLARGVIATLVGVTLAGVVHPMLAAAQRIEDGSRGFVGAPADGVNAALATLLLAETGGVRWETIGWTLGVVILALVLLVIGYVYRMAVGNLRPPPVTILKPGEKITGD